MLLLKVSGWASGPGLRLVRKLGGDELYHSELRTEVACTAGHLWRRPLVSCAGWYLELHLSGNFAAASSLVSRCPALKGEAWASALGCGYHA
jgi:hypothetical protein